MAVYVDDVRHAYGRMIMCHLWADTLEELLDMADTIGVGRKWIQGHPELSHGKARLAAWTHFDISLGKKALALANGAVLTDKYGPVEFVSKRKLQDKSLPRPVRARARRMLALIEDIRATRLGEQA